MGSGGGHSLVTNCGTTSGRNRPFAWCQQQDRSANTPRLLFGGPENLRAADPRHALQENGGPADFRYDRALVLVASDTLKAKIGSERYRKHRLHFHVLADLDKTFLVWKVNEIHALATVATASHGNITLGIAVGPRRCMEDQLLAKADVIRAMHEHVQLCQDPQTEFASVRESLGISRANHFFRVYGHMIMAEEKAPKNFQVGQGSLQRLFPGFTEDSAQQATFTAGQSGTGCERSVNIARPAHLGAGVPVRPRIKDMIWDATTLRLVAAQSILTRLDDLVEIASEGHSARVLAKKAAQVANTAWKEIQHGHNGSSIAAPTVAEMEQTDPTRQEDEDAEEVTSAAARRGRLSAPQLQTPLSWLSDRTRSRRSKDPCKPKRRGNAWRGLRTCVAHTSPTKLGRVFGSVLAPHDFLVNVQKALGNRGHISEGGCRLCGTFLVHAMLGGLKLADSGVTTQPQRLTETTSRSADLFTTTTVSGRSTTEGKSKILEDKVLSTVRWSGRSMGGHTLQSHGPCKMQWTSQHAAMDNECQKQPSNTGGNMRFKLLCFGKGQSC